MADLPPSTNGNSPLISPPSTTVTSPLLSPPSTTVTSPLITPPSTTRNEFRYSFPVVVLDTIWNLAFVVMSAIMLISTAKEKPDVLIRFWLAGRMLNCVVHVVQILLEYNRRTRGAANESESSNTSISSSIGIRVIVVILRELGGAYTYFSKYWWNFGLIWMVFGAKTLKHDAPCLFWFTNAFLAPDVLFGLIRFNSRLFYTFSLRHQGGVSPDDISNLPKYSFEVLNDEERPDGRACRMVPMGTNGPTFSDVRDLQAEDVGCCICLRDYEDGEKLNSLPCNHHFHAACLFKWLRVKATCPLCKYVIN